MPVETALVVTSNGRIANSISTTELDEVVTFEADPEDQQQALRRGHSSTPSLPASDSDDGSIDFEYI